MRDDPLMNPYIATVSKDGEWVVNTYTLHTGNVCSNPELTFQHADLSVALRPGATRRAELKTFGFRASLADLWAKIKAEKESQISENR